MALLAIMEFEGGTIEEYEQINDVIGVHSANDAPDGLIRHVAGTSDDGSFTVDGNHALSITTAGAVSAWYGKGGNGTNGAISGRISKTG
jgi:hypothetical protein